MSARIDHRSTPQHAAREYVGAATASAIQTTSADSRASRCIYPSKRCENLRAVKRNGQLHRFCEFHREKANASQRRLEHRRKVELVLERMSIDACTQELNEQYEALMRQEELAGDEDLPPSDLLVRLDLDEDDLRVLAAVLCVDDRYMDDDTT